MGIATVESLSDIEAARAAQDLARFPNVSAVCVAGSSARGDFDDDSDIDLLALVEDRDEAVLVRATVARERAGRRVQLRLLSEAKLTRLLEGRSTFVLPVGSLLDRQSRRVHDLGTQFAV